jgi:hypothetical protein
VHSLFDQLLDGVSIRQCIVRALPAERERAGCRTLQRARWIAVPRS